MKKRISILLALVMLLSLCACGSSAAQTEASMDIAPMEAPRSVMGLIQRIRIRRCGGRLRRL